MKIAILSFYSGNIERGAENWVYEFSLRLSKNHKVTVFQKKNNNSIFEFTISLLPQLWNDDFDLYIPINGGWQPIITRILTWIKGKKMMIVGHSGKGLDDRINLWTFPDLFVALTNHAKKWAKEINPFVRVEHIPNGVDLKVFNSVGQKLDFNLKEPIVLCASALVKSKRIDLTIKAVALLENVSLFVVGKGEKEKELNELGKRLLGNRFYMTSFPYKKMPEVYRSVDLFTLASWQSESSPLVYLEALASNLPVVATLDEVRKEIIGKAGILIEPEDIQLYAKTIDRALKQKWGVIPRKQAEKFSWQKVINEYERNLNL